MSGLGPLSLLEGHEFPFKVVRAMRNATFFGELWLELCALHNPLLTTRFHFVFGGGGEKKFNCEGAPSIASSSPLYAVPIEAMPNTKGVSCMLYACFFSFFFVSIS